MSNGKWRKDLSYEERFLYSADPRSGLVLDRRFGHRSLMRLTLADDARAQLSERAKVMQQDSEAMVSVSEIAGVALGGPDEYALIELGDESFVHIPTIFSATMIVTGKSNDAISYTLTIEIDDEHQEALVTGLTIAPVVGPLLMSEMIPSASTVERWKEWAMIEVSTAVVVTRDKKSTTISHLDDIAHVIAKISEISQRRRRSDAPPDDLLRLVSDLRRKGMPVSEIRLNSKVIASNGGKEPHRGTVYTWLNRAREEMGL